MIGSPLELFLFGILALLLCIGATVEIRKGIASPYFLFFFYLVIGIVIRRYFLSKPDSMEESAFWWHVLPQVQGEFTAAYVELILIVVFALIVSKLLSPLWERRTGWLTEFFAMPHPQVNFAATSLAAYFSCAAFIAFLAVSQGGIEPAFEMLQKRSLIFGSEVFFIRVLLVFFSLSVAMMVYKLSCLQGTAGWDQIALCTFAVAINLLILFLTGGRGALLTQVLTLMYLRTRGRGQEGLGIKNAVILAIFVPLVIVVGLAIRKSAVQGNDMTEAIPSSVASVSDMVSGAFPILDLYLAARHYAESTGHDYGLQFLQYFVRFVPRSVWADKPLLLGLQIRNFYSGTTISGAPPTVFGEFYYSWGWGGVVGCGVFLGIALVSLNKLYRQAREDAKYAPLYIVMVTQIVFSALRAGLEIVAFTMLYSLSALLIIKWLSQFVEYLRMLRYR